MNVHDALTDNAMSQNKYPSPLHIYLSIFLWIHILMSTQTLGLQLCSNTAVLYVLDT